LIAVESHDGSDEVFGNLAGIQAVLLALFVAKSAANFGSKPFVTPKFVLAALGEGSLERGFYYKNINMT